MVPPRAVRRVLLPALLAAQVVGAGLALVAGVVGVLAGVVDRKWRILRVATMAGAYVCVEWCALLALLGVWLRRPIHGRAWADAANMAVLGSALDRTLAAAERTLGFRIEVTEPPECRPLSERAPVLALARHGGIGDSLGLVWLLVHRYGRRPRIALKDELAWDPFVDIVLNRLGVCFLPPSSRRHVGGSSLVADMAAQLEPQDALLLFPEGANWTPGRWTRAIRRLRSERGPALASRVALMEHVLPPRWGGVFSCLDARQDLAVVVFAHAGLDRITSARQLWRALPFRSPMTVRWWPSVPPPSLHHERVEWLLAEWAVVDEWIDTHRSKAGQAALG